MISMAVTLTLVLSIFSFGYLQGVLNQKLLARRLANTNLNRLLTQQIVTRIMTDLQLAAKYPDAEGLIGAPMHAVVNGSPTSPLPCANEDPTAANRFTLNAYLVMPTSRCKTKEQLPNTGYTAAETNTFSKTITYPRANFSVPFFGLNRSYAAGANISPATDPVVTIQRVGISEIYRLTINFGVCDPSVFGFGSATPSTCTTPDNLTYMGLINTNTDYFQRTETRF